MAPRKQPHPPIRKPIRDDDVELVEAINAGRPELFEELVQRYQPRLLSFGIKMCGQIQDAEDLVQETFLNIFRYLPTFRYETKFKNWVYRIATTGCLKKKRRSKYAPQRELSLEEFHPSQEALIARELPAWALLPLEKVLSRELNRILQQAILDLPEKYRLVMVLRDLEAFSTAETAQMLDLSTANVKVRLHRARLFVREKLNDYFESEPQS